jgi:carbonic anhydrase/acetyltransferase-like protein (isoleucine patch superfamily)
MAGTADLVGDGDAVRAGAAGRRFAVAWAKAAALRALRREFTTGRGSAGATIRRKRGAAIAISRSARVTGGGRLMVGARWPAYRPERTDLAVLPEAHLVVTGSFSIYAGSRVVVDPGATLELASGFLNARSTIACFHHITIGEGVIIAENVTIRDSDSHTIEGVRQNADPGIHIGDHVWIGLNATILKGVTIGSGAVVAAGAVVTRDIPANALAGGVPAKVIRENVVWHV